MARFKNILVAKPIETVLAGHSALQDRLAAIITAVIAFVLAGLVLAWLVLGGVIQTAQNDLAGAYAVIIQPTTETGAQNLQSMADLAKTVLEASSTVRSVQLYKEALGVLAVAAPEATPETVVEWQKAIAAQLGEQAARITIHAPDTYVQGLQASLGQLQHITLWAGGVLFCMAMGMLAAVVQSKILVEAKNLLLMHYLGAFSSKLATKMALNVTKKLIIPIFLGFFVVFMLYISQFVPEKGHKIENYTLLMAYLGVFAVYVLSVLGVAFAFTYRFLKAVP